MRVRPSRLLIVRISAVLVALVATGCGGTPATSVDSDPTNAPASTSSTTTLPPDPWIEIETDFLQACAESEDTATSNASSRADYCRCAYGEVVEYYGTAEAYLDAPARLTGDAAAVDELLETAFGGCVDLHLN